MTTYEICMLVTRVYSMIGQIFMIIVCSYLAFRIFKYRKDLVFMTKGLVKSILNK